MTIIKVGGDWAYRDQLDGENLKHGEWLRVRWEDGSTTEEKISVVDYNRTISDHGHDCEIPITEAYALIPYRGTVASIRLKGFPAERISR